MLCARRHVHDEYLQGLSYFTHRSSGLCYSADFPTMKRKCVCSFKLLHVRICSPEHLDCILIMMMLMLRKLDNSITMQCILFLKGNLAGSQLSKQKRFLLRKWQRKQICKPTRGENGPPPGSFVCVWHFPGHLQDDTTSLWALCHLLSVMAWGQLLLNLPSCLPGWPGLSM